MCKILHRIQQMASNEGITIGAMERAIGASKGVLSEAENFVSAWLDAYKETGDGLDALNEHWDGFFENLVMRKNKKRGI